MLAHGSVSEALHHFDDFMSTAWFRSGVLIPANANIKSCISCSIRELESRFHLIAKHCWRMKELRLWLRGRQAVLFESWRKPCKVSEREESMEPQLSRTDIHKEGATKRRLSVGNRFGSDLSKNTPPPGDCVTVSFLKKLGSSALFCNSGQVDQSWSGCPGPEASWEWKHTVVQKDN